MKNHIGKCLEDIFSTSMNPMDVVPREELAEKLIELRLHGPSPGLPQGIYAQLDRLVQLVRESDTSNVKVVVFGGGTGLSNIIGGDSRHPSWPMSPFKGLKEIFPSIRAITCITDDGGSTGELLKDLPVIALGDIRHVLLSSIQLHLLQERYGLDTSGAKDVVKAISTIFNYRFTKSPVSVRELANMTGADMESLPSDMRSGIWDLVSRLFKQEKLKHTLNRKQCLGNLLLVSAIYGFVSDDAEKISHKATLEGINSIARIIGAPDHAVLPCSTTPARLQVLYSNGVLVTGEHKSSVARRGYPIERVFVQFSTTPHVPNEVLHSVREADILIFAPGSLYTSIIPILHVPGIAEEVRKNEKALKILVANLWAQEGETDIARDDPSRRFYVSDLVAAYSRNIPGGVKDLFQQVLVLGLKDIPGSILQRYAVENKIPIYLDAGRVKAHGLKPVEAGIFSEQALKERKVVQHSPEAFSKAVQTLWAARTHIELAAHDPYILPAVHDRPRTIKGGFMPHERLDIMREKMEGLNIPDTILPALFDLLWNHQDILPAHLDYINGIELVSPKKWTRSQEWDNILSFFDPEDGMIKIRQDISTRRRAFETAFLVALGESLLGNYAKNKSVVVLEQHGWHIGKIFQVELRTADRRRCFLSDSELKRYLRLARMNHASPKTLFYTRLINGKEGFTPPGLLFGLVYAWYLDNRLTGHIEYKMSIMKGAISDLIPEQIKMLKMRRDMIQFFRKSVFRLDDPAYEK